MRWRRREDGQVWKTCSKERLQVRHERRRWYAYRFFGSWILLKIGELAYIRHNCKISLCYVWRDMWGGRCGMRQWWNENRWWRRNICLGNLLMRWWRSFRNLIQIGTEEFSDALSIFTGLGGFEASTIGNTIIWASTDLSPISAVALWGGSATGVVGTPDLLFLGTTPRNRTCLSLGSSKGFSICPPWVDTSSLLCSDTTCLVATEAFYSFLFFIVGWADSASATSSATFLLG